MREELAKEKRSFKKVREKLKIETVQTSSRTSLRKVSREFFKSERKKKKTHQAVWKRWPFAPVCPRYS